MSFLPPRESGVVQVRTRSRVRVHPADGGARAALGRHVRAARRRMPRVLRALWWVALGVFTACALPVAWLAVTDPQVLGLLAQMLGLTYIVGREGAMLYVYGQDPALGPTWVVLAACLDDLLTLAVLLPVVWFAIERLRAAPLVGGIVLSVEKAVVERRAFVRRWGLYGLLALIWMPGPGAGVCLAALLGLFSRMPLRRLVVAMAGALVASNIFWGVGLFHSAALLPDEGPWSYIPLALLCSLVVVAVVFGLSQRRRRHLFPLVKVQVLTAEHLKRLASVGIDDGIELLYANRKVLAARLGMNPRLLAELRSVAELSLLRTVSPVEARALTAVGIRDIRDLSLAPPGLVAAALHELGMEVPQGASLDRCAEWTEDARVFFVEAEV